eukprot:scaffold17497_cov96-Isochrysis_galbana.AAC.6
MLLLRGTASQVAATLDGFALGLWRVTGGAHHVTTGPGARHDHGMHGQPCACVRSAIDRTLSSFFGAQTPTTREPRPHHALERTPTGQ